MWLYSSAMAARTSDAELTMVRLDGCHTDTTSVGDGSRNVHRQRMHPLGIDSEHVYDEVCGTFGAIYGTTLPVRQQVRIMV